MGRLGGSSNRNGQVDGGCVVSGYDAFGRGDKGRGLNCRLFDIHDENDDDFYIADDNDYVDTYYDDGEDEHEKTGYG